MILSIGLLSYGLAALGFLILTLLLATSWEGRAQGVRLIAACAVTALWASLFAVASQFVVLSGSLVLLAEFLRYGAWFVVLTGLAASAGVAATASRLTHVAWIGCVVFLFVDPAQKLLSPANFTCRSDRSYRKAYQHLASFLVILAVSLGIIFFAQRKANRLGFGQR